MFSLFNGQDDLFNLELVDLIRTSEHLTQQLLILCNYTVKDADAMSMSRNFNELLQIVPVPIIIPLQASLNITLPSKHQDRFTHKPFATDIPTIHGTKIFFLMID